MGMLWTLGVLGESLTGLSWSRVATVRIVAAGEELDWTAGFDDMEEAPELEPEDGLTDDDPYLVDSLMFLGGRAGLGGLAVRPGFACLGLDVAITNMSNSLPESPV